MAVRNAVGISRQRNSGYRPSRVNTIAQGLFTPDPSLSPTHFSIRRSHATTTHYTHHQVSLVVSRNTTLVPSLGLRIGQPVRQASALACEGSVCHPNKKERKKEAEVAELGWSDAMNTFPNHQGRLEAVGLNTAGHYRTKYRRTAQDTA